MEREQLISSPPLSLVRSADADNTVPLVAVAKYAALMGRLRSSRDAAKAGGDVGGAASIGSLEAMYKRLPPTVAEVNARYVKVRKIGEGGFGEVCLAYDKQLDTFVTIKKMKVLLHESYRSGVGLHYTIARELNILLQLAHPNIVPLLRYDILDDGTCLVVFPVISHDLAALVKMWRTSDRHTGRICVHGRMPLAMIKCIFKQLIEGLQYLHSMHVIHRDIKLGNVLVHRDGTVFIIDFGWSRFAPIGCTSPLMTGPPCTITYRAPEILIGGVSAHSYHSSLDIWSCGVVLWEMMSGEPFSKCETELDALAHIVDIFGPPEPNSERYFGHGPRARHEEKKGPWCVQRPPVSAAQGSSFRSIAHRFRWEPTLMSLLTSMLCWEPTKRLRCDDVLAHPWLVKTEPLPARKEDLMLPEYNAYRRILKERNE